MRNHLLYFPRIMPFTDNTGTEHPESFWHLQNFSIDTDNRILYINFAAYASVEAFEAGEECLVRKGGSWTKTFTGEAYDRLILIYALAVAGVAQATWSIAGQVLDTPNEGGVFQSFFAGAGEILAPPELQELFKK